MKNGSAASCQKQGLSFRKYFVCLLKTRVINFRAKNTYLTSSGKDTYIYNKPTQNDQWMEHMIKEPTSRTDTEVEK
jgi:hypothetical protein